MHGGYGYGVRNADGSRILEFADGLNLVICNALFMKQESKLVTYEADPAKSTVDSIIVRRGDKAKVHNVKVIPIEECVSQHKFLVMDMQLNTTKRRHKKFEPRVRVWKLKEKQTCEEYKSMVRDKVEEEEWKHLDVNEHWHKMKKIMMETAQHICGMSKSPCRHKETWWWNEEVAEAVREKKIKYRKTEERKFRLSRSQYWLEIWLLATCGHGLQRSSMN